MPAPTRHPRLAQGFEFPGGWGQRDGYRVSFSDDENVLEPEKQLHNIANYDMSLLEMAFKVVHFDLMSNFKRGYGIPSCGSRTLFLSFSLPRAFPVFLQGKNWDLP